MTLQQNELILVIDNDSDFIEGLKQQAQALGDKQNFIFLCYGKPDFIETLKEYSTEIVAVFLDFDIGIDHNPEVLMKSMGNYLNWAQVRVFWFTGADQLNTTAIKMAKKNYPTLSPNYLRKPLTLSTFEASFCENFKLAEQWKHFPKPLRVINKKGQIVFTNSYWHCPDNLPAPSAFIKQQCFVTEKRDFFNQLPSSPDAEVGYFRLCSFQSDDGRHLFQYAEGVNETVNRNDWLSLVEKIAISLGELGFTRVRFCRYLNVPRYDEKMLKTNDVEHGILALCWSSTTLTDGKSRGERKSPKRIPLVDRPLLDRMKKMVADYDNQENEIIFNITTEKNRGEDLDWDKLIIPTKNTKGYSIVELPLFTENQETIKIIGNPHLLGKFTFDRYNDEKDSFEMIVEEDIHRLKKYLTNFCEELAKTMEYDIKQTSKSHEQTYAQLDEEMIGGFEKPETLLKKLLDHAVVDVEADMGYITEKRVAGYEVTISLDKESSKLGLFDFFPKNVSFRGALFKHDKNTNNLPILRCWQSGKIISLPDLNNEKTIRDILVDAYGDAGQVAYLGEGEVDRSRWQKYFEELGSFLILPVIAGKEQQVAAIVLHSKKAYHFDDERLERLKNLTSRASWLLAVSRYKEQRELLLDGVMHEIKSDATPLNKHLVKLKVDAESDSDWRRCRYFGMRLEISAKSLLWLSSGQTDNGLEIDPTQCCTDMIQNLENLIGAYQPDMDDKGLKLEFQPNLDNLIWSQELAMSSDWFVHIIGNLLDNAVKYSKRNGIIFIRSGSEERGGKQGFKLMFINTGDISDIQRMEAFNSTHHSEKRDGFHVGLASCKKLIELHQGEISLDNGPLSNQVNATVWWPIEEI
ncbi:MAG: sensor histidine kinase [Methylococcaceae bacterium]